MPMSDSAPSGGSGSGRKPVGRKPTRPTLGVHELLAHDLVAGRVLGDRQAHVAVERALRRPGLRVARPVEVQVAHLGREPVQRQQPALGEALGEVRVLVGQVGDRRAPRRRACRRPAAVSVARVDCLAEQRVLQQRGDAVLDLGVAVGEVAGGSSVSRVASNSSARPNWPWMLRPCGEHRVVVGEPVERQAQRLGAHDPAEDRVAVGGQVRLAGRGSRSSPRDGRSSSRRGCGRGRRSAPPTAGRRGGRRGRRAAGSSGAAAACWPAAPRAASRCRRRPPSSWSPTARRCRRRAGGSSSRKTSWK